MLFRSKIESSEHYLLNKPVRFPKRITWMPIEIKMISAKNMVGSTADDFYSILYNNAIQQNYTMGKNNLSFSSISITQVNSFGEDLETWTLNNAWITGVNFGSLSYDNDAFVEITLQITYDSAELSTFEVDEVAKIKAEELKLKAQQQSEADTTRMRNQDVLSRLQGNQTINKAANAPSTPAQLLGLPTGQDVA